MRSRLFVTMCLSLLTRFESNTHWWPSDRRLDNVSNGVEERLHWDVSSALYCSEWHCVQCALAAVLHKDVVFYETWFLSDFREFFNGFISDTRTLMSVKCTRQNCAALCKCNQVRRWIILSLFCIMCTQEAVEYVHWWTQLAATGCWHGCQTYKVLRLVHPNNSVVRVCSMLDLHSCFSEKAWFEVFDNFWIAVCGGLKCHRRQGNAVPPPPVFGSKRSPSSDFRKTQGKTATRCEPTL